MGLILSLVQVVVLIVIVADRGGGGSSVNLAPLLLGASLVPLAFTACATAVGWGLSRGRRSAVLGAAILGGLSLLAGLALVLLGAIGWGGNEPLWVGLGVCAVTGVVWAPPLLRGWQHRAELS